MVDEITNKLFAPAQPLQPRRGSISPCLMLLGSSRRFRGQLVAQTHSRIVATFARTSSMIASGTSSSFLPLRALRSSARGWSQRTTPVVLVPAPVRDTANPAVRAKFPPLVMGRTTGALVTWLKASGEMTKTGRRPFCSCPSAGSRPKISPRLIRSTPAGGAYTDSYACVARPSEVKSGAVAVQGRRFHREERRQRSPGLLGVVVHRRFDCQGRV